ncbi:MAG: hypothetical protein WAN03_06875 [Candidatus Sulfotelmatobacter sp.]
MGGERVSHGAGDENGSDLWNDGRGLCFRQSTAAVVIEAAATGGDGYFGLRAGGCVTLVSHAQTARTRRRSSGGQRHRKKIPGERE